MRSGLVKRLEDVTRVAQIARHTLFGMVRMFRRAGFALTVTFGMLLTLFVIAGAAFGTGEWRENRGEAFAADRPLPGFTEHSVPEGAPWSHVIGGREFDTITAVTETAGGDMVFAGLSLGMEGRDSSVGHLIRTDRRGRLQTRQEIDNSRIGRISKIALAPDGGSRVLHWVDADLGFARTDGTGKVLWSRRFSSPSDTAWGDVSAGHDDETLIAIVDGNASGQVRLMRLDGQGKSLWRHNLNAGEATANLTVAAAGEGGALLALASSDGEGGQIVSLRRFDHRGRLAWEREVYRGQTARLADARLDNDRVGLLVAGEPAGLFVYDTFGTPVWVREVTPLNEYGRHVLARHAGRGYQVIGEPRHADGAGEIWLASYGEDGRELWTRSRANRTNSIFEDIHVTPDGTIIAGGSLTDPLAGNTDMLMMRLSADGAFPTGYENMAAEAPLFADLPPTDTSPDAGTGAGGNTIHAVASSRLPVMAASVIVDEVVAEADRQATAVRTRAAADGQVATRQVAATLPIADDTASPQPRVGEPEATATKPAPAVDKPEPVAPISSEPAAMPASPEAPAQRPSSRPEMQLAATRVPEPVSRMRTRRQIPQQAAEDVIEAESFAYRCTFTCAAKADDTVKYPVDKVIRDVSEDNAGLVALDVLAMDNGVCLASGGVVFDAPRLPPVCQRVE